MGVCLLSVVFDKHLFNKIVWNHVAHNNFTIHGNRCGIACSTDSIVCTYCCGKVFQTLYGVFMYFRKTYRMGFLCIPGYICILCFSRDSQGCRFPFLHRESCSIHKHSVFIHNKKTRRESVSQVTERFMLLNSAMILSFSPFFLMQETVILRTGNNNIMTCGMMQNKKRVYVFVFTKRANRAMS